MPEPIQVVEGTGGVSVTMTDWPGIDELSGDVHHIPIAQIEVRIPGSEKWLAVPVKYGGQIEYPDNCTVVKCAEWFDSADLGAKHGLRRDGPWFFRFVIFLGQTPSKPSPHSMVNLALTPSAAPPAPLLKVVEPIVLRQQLPQ
jgi:hypothetical protein